MTNRRESPRTHSNIDAKIISEGKTFEGSIENVSEDGMEYLMTSFIQASKDFTPDKRIDLVFKAPSGEMISLDCEVVWFLKAEPREDNLVLGMRIINPPVQYRNMVKDLHRQNSK